MCVFGFLSFEHIFVFLKFDMFPENSSTCFFIFSQVNVLFSISSCVLALFHLFSTTCVNSKCFSCILPSFWCLGQVACFASSRDNTRKFLVWIGTSLHQDMVSLAYLPLKLRTRKCTVCVGLPGCRKDG